MIDLIGIIKDIPKSAKIKRESTAASEAMEIASVVMATDCPSSFESLGRKFLSGSLMPHPYFDTLQEYQAFRRVWEGIYAQKLPEYSWK